MLKVTDKGYWMHAYLKQQADIVLLNMKDDWDFVWIISGSGMVRVGKSVLAQQIGYYIAYNKGIPFNINNIVFSGKELIERGKNLPKNSSIIYDEARGELDSKKTTSSVSMILQDFFAECGMYNHFFILVLPDFFELNKYIAINRSELLINITRQAEVIDIKDSKEEEFNKLLKYKRGRYHLYGRQAKKRLYIKGKKVFNDYSQQKFDAWGDFNDFHIINETEYLDKKREYLSREREPTIPEQNVAKRLTACLRTLNEQYSEEEIAQKLKKYNINLTRQRINQLMHPEKKKILL